MRRILVVDDEKLVRWSLENSLMKAGYSATAVDDGDAAVKVLEDDEYSVVITDVKLGDMSGLDLLAHIKRTRPGLPVILITAYGDEKMRSDAESGGAAGFFDKPFDIGVLLELVGELCGRR